MGQCVRTPNSPKYSDPIEKQLPAYEQSPDKDIEITHAN